MNKALGADVSATDFSFVGKFDLKKNWLLPLALIMPVNSAVHMIKSYAFPLPSTTSLIQKTDASTVVIDVLPPKGGEYEGAGWIIDNKGDIVTAYHLASKKDVKVSVTFNGIAYPAVVVGDDKTSDISVLRISYTKGTPLDWGDSDTVTVGAQIVRAGDPLDFGMTPAVGMVAATHRAVDSSITEYIQDNAQATHGDSGGPVVDQNGQVIAMSDEIGLNDGSQVPDIAFDIPSNEIRKAANDILKWGRVIPGAPTFNYDDATPLDPTFSLTQARGAGAIIKSVVAHSDAAHAGLQKRDIIIKFDNTPIYNGTDLGMAIYMTHPGEQHNLTVLRKGKTLIIDLVMGGRFPATPPGRDALALSGSYSNGRMLISASRF